MVAYFRIANAHLQARNFGQKKWVRGVREGGFALDPPSQHSLAQGGEGGKDAFWILLAAKRVPHKI